MPDKILRIQQLLEKYVRNECSEEEEAELIDVIHEGKYVELIRQFIRKTIDAGIPEDVKSLEPWRSNEIFNLVTQDTGSHRVKRMFNWRRIAAAAILVIGLFSGIYFLRSGDSEPEPGFAQQVNAEQDIAPGTFGAVLVLGDGSQVVIDSTSNGTISVQGNAAVQKKNGIISYTPSGEDTVVVYNTMITPKGRKYKLELADGTVVWLNAESEITFPTAFTGVNREVTIKGEVYFEVTRQANRPFTVKVGNRQEITVLGTRFNINAYENESEIRTTLLEGSIRVQNSMGKSVVLTPGQQALMSSTGALRTSNNVDMEGVMAWKNGFFYFKDADIRTIMRQLSRWYDVEVVYPETLPNWNFTGEIGAELSLKELLEGLAFTNIKFKIDGKKLILLQQ